MKAIITLLILTVFISCNKDDSNEKTTVFFDTSVEISAKNVNGEDLLNPNNPNAYKTENIKIYYLINGEKQEVNDNKMDYPRSFLVYQNGEDFRIRIFKNNSKIEGLPITYIKWNENETDTIQTEYDRTYSNEPRMQKVWFNGELKWDIKNGEEGFFKILKQKTYFNLKSKNLLIRP